MDLNTQIEALGGAMHMGLQRMIHADPSGAHRKGQLGGEGYKAFPTQHGYVYEVSKGVQMADVLPSTAQPELYIDRRLAASTIGARREDADALTLARAHPKPLSVGTSRHTNPAFL